GATRRIQIPTLSQRTRRGGAPTKYPAQAKVADEWPTCPSNLSPALSRQCTLDFPLKWRNGVWIDYRCYGRQGKTGARRKFVSAIAGRRLYRPRTQRSFAGEKQAPRA